MLSALIRSARQTSSLFVKLAPELSAKTAQPSRSIHIPRVEIPQTLTEAVQGRSLFLRQKHKGIQLPFSKEFITKESSLFEKFIAKEPSCAELLSARKDLLSRKADAIFFQNSIPSTGTEDHFFSITPDVRNIGRDKRQLNPDLLIEKNALNLLFIACFLSDKYISAANHRVPGMAPYHVLSDIHEQELHTDGVFFSGKRSVEFNCLTAINADGQIGTLFIGTDDIISQLDKTTIEILQKPIFKNHRDDPEPAIRIDSQGRYKIVYNTRSNLDESLCKEYGVDPNIAVDACDRFLDAKDEALSEKCEKLFLETGNQILFHNTPHKRMGKKVEDKKPSSIIKGEELRTLIASTHTNATERDR